MPSPEMPTVESLEKTDPVATGLRQMGCDGDVISASVPSTRSIALPVEYYTQDILSKTIFAR